MEPSPGCGVEFDDRGGGGDFGRQDRAVQPGDVDIVSAGGVGLSIFYANPSAHYDAGQSGSAPHPAAGNFAGRAARLGRTALPQRGTSHVSTRSRSRCLAWAITVRSFRSRRLLRSCIRNNDSNSRFLDLTFAQFAGYTQNLVRVLQRRRDSRRTARPMFRRLTRLTKSRGGAFITSPTSTTTLTAQQYTRYV